MIRFYYMISIMHIMSEREIASLVERLLHTKPFDYNYHNKVGVGVRGLYSFWLRGCCLYVGRSIDIRRRLWEHRTNEANPILDKYRRAFSREIEVSHVPLKDITEPILSDIEAKVIRAMSPKTNRQNT